MKSIVDCLATNIKKLRLERDWTQSYLADQAGISLIFLQGIEAKKKWVSPATARSIARALKVEEAKLFENCFPIKIQQKKSRRLQRPPLDHVPDDIFNALATTCRQSTWSWESFRWIIQGYQRQIES